MFAGRGPPPSRSLALSLALDRPGNSVGFHPCPEPRVNSLGAALPGWGGRIRTSVWWNQNPTPGFDLFGNSAFMLSTPRQPSHARPGRGHSPRRAEQTALATPRGTSPNVRGPAIPLSNTDTISHNSSFSGRDMHQTGFVRKLPVKVRRTGKARPWFDAEKRCASWL